MIRADTLKGMVDSCAKVLASGDQAVVGVTIENGGLTVFASGAKGEIRRSKAIEDAPDGKDFTVGVDYASLSKILGGSGTGPVKISANQSSFILKGAINAKIGISESPPKMKIQTNTKYKIPAEWFRRCAMLAPRFAAADRTQYVLNVARFEISGNVISFVAADGRKGVTADAQCENNDNKDLKFSVPISAMEILSSVMPPSNNTVLDLEVGDGAGGFVVGYDDFEYGAGLMEDKYPEQWRSVFVKSPSMAAIDGKMLGKFSSILDALEVTTAKFTSDGKSLKIFGRSMVIPEIDTELSTSIPPGEMYLDPAMLAGSLFDSAQFQFGWGAHEEGQPPDCAVFVSSPFTAICMGCEP